MNLVKGLPFTLPSKIAFVLICFFLIIGIIFRLQNFHLLPIDGHAMRQTDTESVAYNYAFHNGNILYPQNSLIRPITNKESYFFLEFPVYEYTISLFYRIFGWHIEVARIINLSLFVLSVIMLFYFVKKYFNNSIAFFCAFYFIFAPASIFFLGHALHPDVFAIAMLLISLASIIKWKESEMVFYIVVSIFSLCLATVTRPFILIVLPAYFFLLWDLKVNKYISAAFLIFPLLSYGLWNYWILLFKATANTDWETWILNGRNQLLDKTILLNRLILKNIIGEVIGKSISILAFVGVVLMLIKKNKKYFFILSWLICIPIYWLIVPNGNIIHQYYANVYLIPVIISAAAGINIIANFLSKKAPIMVWPLLIFIFIIVVYNGVHTSNFYFKNIISISDQKIAENIKDNIAENSRLIYLQKDNSIPFSLYHRKGWMLGDNPTDVSASAVTILAQKKYGNQYIVESKTYSPLSEKDTNIIKINSILVFSSKYCNIYKIK